MNDIKTGGLVFPQTNRIKETYMDEGGYARQRSISLNLGGISVRDYFAASALQGFCSGPEYGLAENKAAGLTWIQVTTKYAYEIADAMLKEREREYD